MKKSEYNENRKKYAIKIILAGIMFGALYPALSREFGDPVAFVNGLLIGFFGSSFIAFYELYAPHKQRRNFAKKFGLKTLAYTCFFAFLIPLVISITRSIESQQGYLAHIKGPEFKNFILYEDYLVIVLYTLFLSGTIILINQLNRKLGPGIVWRIISGKYYSPREEERIFMFLDLNNSTEITEKLGDVKYNKMLNEFFYDITGSILNSLGEIYRYVGDEVEITWPLQNGLNKANCLEVFFKARKAILQAKKKYITKYGFTPTFSVGCHLGKVIVGELGDIKSRIAFNGEVMYVTRNIEKECKKYNVENLISSELLKRIELPDFYSATKAGNLETGGGNVIGLYTVKEL